MLGRLCTSLVALAIGILTLPAQSQAQWQYSGTLKVPEYFYTFLATTPSGDLLAATFNRDAGDGGEIPAVLIKNPTSASPEVQELCRVAFPETRGFGGVACDAAGNFYLSGDTGEPATGFLRKFRPDGSPATDFGQAGVVVPRRRCLGVETISEYVLLAVDWGEVMVLRADTGAPVGMVPKLSDSVNMRDITIDPRSLRIFGVGQGGIYTWGGAAPWEPNRYRSRAVTPRFLGPFVGEGLTLDPFKRCVVNTPPAGGEVREVYGDGRIVTSAIPATEQKSSLTDSAVSFDGTTLFVSDYVLKRIYVLKREAPERQSTEAGTYAKTAQAADHSVKWSRSYEQVVQEARTAKKPMLVYFRAANLRPCEEFEKNVLLTEEFTQGLGGIVPVFEDAKANRLLAYRFGVLRVPTVVLFDSKGDVLAEFRHPIDKSMLLSSMTAANKR